MKTLSDLPDDDALSSHLTDRRRRHSNSLSKMEGSSDPNSNELEQVHDIVLNGTHTSPGQIEKVMAEDVQKESEGSKAEENISVSAKIVKSGEISTELLSDGDLPEDTKLRSPGPVKFQAKQQVTVDNNHEFDSEMINIEAFQENNVINTENTDNGPIKDQSSEYDCINMEQKGAIADEMIQNSCLESLTSQIGNQFRKCSSDQLDLLPDNAAKDCELNFEEQIDTAHNADLEKLRPGQKTAGSARHRKGPNSLTSSGNRVKVLPEKRKKNQELSVNSSRTLRSRSTEEPKAPHSSNIVAEEGSVREKKKKQKKKLMKKGRVDEFHRIRTHLRYLLQRIKYEKNFIDAYSGEGWKGQSLEKIKPEKELERAKSEIFRRKLKIRDLFKQLDSLCAEGRLPDNVFDAEGEIDSEDIFCAKCGSKDVTLSNDIILCDGACERGFHQFCLNPPLLKECIPSDDEGWLCPGCDCKVDCFELLNDSQETKFSVIDSWEKVFAEEAAAAAAGKNLDYSSGLPSDDSEDDDYDPDRPDFDEKVQGDVSSSEKSSSDESDYHSASDDVQDLPQKELVLGLPSDDSEDDDYDPSGLNADQKSGMESSSSDFTSDSEDVTVVLNDCKPSSEVQGPPALTPGHVRSNEDGGMHPEQGEPACLYPRRQVQRLDYKKLHDEEYGNSSSDSIDEDYDMDIGSPDRKDNESGKDNTSVLPHLENLSTKHGEEAGDIELDQKASGSTRKRRCIKKLDAEGTGSTLVRSCKGSPAPLSSGKSNSKYGPHATQRLLHSFKENQYPQRVVKESLATELKLSVQQVSKWFENARWSFRHSSHMASDVTESVSDKGIRDNIPSSEVEKKKQVIGNPDAKECCDRDAMPTMAVQEGNGQDPGITKTRKRRDKVASEATNPNTSLKTPKRNAKVNSPKTQEVRRSSRLKSKSTDSVA